MRPDWYAPLAVGGGWLAVMPNSILTLALRAHEIDAPWFVYSLILISGWATLIAAINVFGRIADRQRANARMIRVTLLVSALLLVALGLGLAETYSDLLLPALWALLQIPAAAIIAIGMTFATHEQDRKRLRVTSAIIGAMPLIAILLGSGIVQIAPTTAVAFRVPAIIAALVTLPFALTAHANPVSEVRAESDVVRTSNERGWRWYLVTSFLTSWTTSATTSYLVPYASVHLRVRGDDLAIATSRILMAATVLSILGSLVLALGSERLPLPKARLPFGIALMTFGAALIPGVSNIEALAIGACFTGFGFGVVNGVELAYLREFAAHGRDTGRRIGTLTAATTIPYVAVPGVTAASQATSADTGLVATFWLAAVASFLALVAATRLVDLTRR